MRVPLWCMGLSITAIAQSALAQPPQAGSIGPLDMPSIVCDTAAQVQAIVEGFAKGKAAGEARYTELSVRRNARNEPTCAVMPIDIALTVESKSLGKLTLAGGDVYGWIVHIENDVGDAYYLYLESPAHALRDTI